MNGDQCGRISLISLSIFIYDFNDGKDKVCITLDD